MIYMKLFQAKKIFKNEKPETFLVLAIWIKNF